MAQTFGATVAGVIAYVPELGLDPVADATTIQTFLDVVGPQAAAVLGARLRALEALSAAGVTEAGDVVDEATAAAKGLVQMGGASLTQDSRYPELAATRNTDQAWGASLWAKYESALEQLAASLDADLERLGVDTVDPTAAGADLPDVSAPPVTFRDAMKF